MHPKYNSEQIQDHMCFTLSTWSKVVAFLHLLLGPSSFGEVVLSPPRHFWWCLASTFFRVVLPFSSESDVMRRQVEKGWSFLLLFGGVAFPPLSFLAVLLRVVLQSHPSLVWCSFPILGRAASSCLLFGGCAVAPHFFEMEMNELVSFSLMKLRTCNEITVK